MNDFNSYAGNVIILILYLVCINVASQSLLSIIVVNVGITVPVSGYKPVLCAVTTSNRGQRLSLNLLSWLEHYRVPVLETCLPFLPSWLVCPPPR